MWVLGGAEGNRTPDLLIANEALYHLSYGPKERRRYGPKARSSSGSLLASARAARQEAESPDGKPMTAIIQFVFFILGGLLSLLWWAIVISAILSWLVAFDVINRRNNAVYQILDFLDRVTGPVLRPFQRVIPSLGGVDISPIIVLLIISGVQNYLLPALRMTLVGLVG